MSFQVNKQGAVALWTGAPNCDAAQTHIREWLRANVPNYPTQWEKGDTRTQGNLGESIAFCVGVFSGMGELRCFSANAFNPFSGISKSEIDLLWVSFGPSSADDRIIHQEVKTTFGKDLSYANALIPDYRKAFGKNPRYTFNTHLQHIKSKLRFEHKRPELADRINALMAADPATAIRTIIVPTLIHDLGSDDPAAKMAGVSAALQGQGWAAVTPWTIGLSQLEDRMTRITADQP